MPPALPGDTYLSPLAQRDDAEFLRLEAPGLDCPERNSSQLFGIIRHSARLLEFSPRLVVRTTKSGARFTSTVTGKYAAGPGKVDRMGEKRQSGDFTRNRATSRQRCVAVAALNDAAEVRPAASSRLTVRTRRLPSVRSANPQQGVLEHLVLVRIGQDLVAVSHVDVDHPVFRIGPHHGHIAGCDGVLQAQRKIRTLQGQ